MVRVGIWQRRTTRMSVLLFGLLSGIVIGKFIQPFTISTVLVTTVCVLALIVKKKKFVAIGYLFIGVIWGAWRAGVYMDRLKGYDDLNGTKVVLRVKADSSAVYGANAQLEFDASQIVVVEPGYSKLPGRMVISGYGENSILRGDVVTVHGKVYPRRGSKQAGVSYAQLHVLTRSRSYLEKVRRGFLAGLATSLPEPHDQFAAGLLVGQKSELASDVAEKLRIVGLSHIIAVSGYNLTIMADVARKRLGKRSRFQSTFFSIVFVALFVALAGTSASIARAAFVSVLTIVAAHYGRQIKPVLLILLAAGFTAWTNPLNIWSDIGWHLSFLAFFGVLVVAPAIQGRLYVGDKKPLMASKVVIETTSAQIMTVPISLYIFGQVSLISLLANIAVVPLVPLAMLFSLLAGVAGMIMPALAGIVAWPARVLLDFILSVTSLLSRVPHALEKMSINLATLIVAYCLVVVIVAALRHKTSQSVTITE